MSKLNNKDTRTTTMASFWYLYCQLRTYFTPCSSISIANSGHVIAGWEEDASFLDEIGRLFDSHKRSTLFLPHRTKLFSNYNEARRSVKRRIE